MSKVSNRVQLPDINKTMLPSISTIISALKVPRDVIANDEEIGVAWNSLPRELHSIPPELRTELLARMCIAVSVGLFDGAMNYVWNASVINLRKKVKDFGFNVVGQISDDDFNETKLNNLKDAELLSLCLKLNLISEEGFYFLDQCRDMRNNFSAAHPSIGFINDRELIAYINRCAKYALSTTVNPTGVHLNTFLSAVKGQVFTAPQLDTWIERLKNTHDAQRELLFGMLHGIYCDPSSNEESRINALLISKAFASIFTPSIRSNFLNRHYDYQAKGDTQRHNASQLYFERLGLLSFLNDIERHSIISTSCKKLASVHLAYDNFYNEPPFAQRLCELSQQNEIPQSAQEEYVFTVLTCFVGNEYGISDAAILYYEKMIKNFSPKEIQIMLNVKNTNTRLATRMKAYSRCRNRYKASLKLLNENSIPVSIKSVYEQLLK